MRNFLLLGVGPLAGAAMLAWLLVLSVRDLADAENSYTGQAWLGVGPPLVIGVGVLAAGVVLMLWWRRRDATFWRDPGQCRRPPSSSSSHQGGDPLRPRRGGGGGVHPPEDGVAVGPVQRLELLLRGGLGGQRRGEVVGHGDRGRAGVGALPPAVGPRRLDGGQPGGAHPARRAISASTASTFFCDHTLLGPPRA